MHYKKHEQNRRRKARKRNEQSFLDHIIRCFGRSTYTTGAAWDYELANTTLAELKELSEKMKMLLPAPYSNGFFTLTKQTYVGFEYGALPFMSDVKLPEVKS